MKKNTFSFLLLLIVLASKAQFPSDSFALRKVYDYYLTESKCYKNLEFLATKIGGRISGSAQAEKAVYWAKQAMIEAGADTVFLQPCMVPHWVRGKKEVCVVTVKGITEKLNVCALGSSVGTPVNGINANVIEVSSFDELEKLGEAKIRGKIVFYNVFFDPKKITTGEAYGESVRYRWAGASRAAKYGAVASVVRSMSSAHNDFPHTGNMGYDTTVTKLKIPALALSFTAADKLSALLKSQPNLTMKLVTDCKNLPEVLSYNVVGQIRGTEKKNEFIITGGHLDSWDNGQGAHDDGAGVVQSIEILAAFKKLGIKPKHSIRAIAFMNEENGLAGGKAYAEAALKNKEIHIAALETDAGGFTPRGFNVDTLNGLYKKVKSWEPLFRPYFVDRIDAEGGGADIGPLEKQNVPCIGFEPDSQRYFDYHHTSDDTFDKVNKRELELGAAAIGALLYLIDKNY
jgi:carboxypeptidase Q